MQLQDGARVVLGSKQNEKEKGVTGKETGGSTTLRCREESSSRQKGKLQLIFEEDDIDDDGAKRERGVVRLWLCLTEAGRFILALL